MKLYKQKITKNDIKKRTIFIIIYVLLASITAYFSYHVGINPPMVNVYGMYVSVLIYLFFSHIMKFSDEFFLSGLIFVYMASPMGSVINLYRSLGLYDKVVHFISGILLAALGTIIVKKLMEKAKIDKSTPMTILITTLTAFTFSSAAAGIWEIIEFLADLLAGGEMQRGMVDTVTDIIAGNIGAIFFSVGMLIKELRRKPGTWKEIIKCLIQKKSQ